MPVYAGAPRPDDTFHLRENQVVHPSPAELVLYPERLLDFTGLPIPTAFRIVRTYARGDYALSHQRADPTEPVY